LVALVAGVALLAGTTASADEGVEVPSAVEPTRIAARHIEGHSFTFGVDVSPCQGPGVRLDHVKLVERPEDSHGLKAAIVTAYLFHPAHIEGLPCARVRGIRKVRIRTKRRAADLVFFDGSDSPPRRIYPLAN
jgi:hypothetical protein